MKCIICRYSSGDHLIRLINKMFRERKSSLIRGKKFSTLIAMKIDRLDVIALIALNHFNTSFADRECLFYVEEFPQQRQQLQERIFNGNANERNINIYASLLFCRFSDSLLTLLLLHFLSLFSCVARLKCL